MDSGTPDSGTPDSGQVYFTIAQARAYLTAQINAGVTTRFNTTFPAVIQNVIIAEVEDTFLVTTKDAGVTIPQGQRGLFWVVDPLSPKDGIWVEKFTFDPAQDSTATANVYYVPTPGDIVTLNGYVHERPNANYNTVGSSYRYMVSSGFYAGKRGTLLKIKLLADGGTTVMPAPNEAPVGFGNAQGGTVKPNADYAGARVHIPGPLTITNANPVAMTQWVSDTFPPTQDVPFGFEVGSPDGGYMSVLIFDQKIASYRSDGGLRTGGCDPAGFLRDGGTSVTFPNGITGTWDTMSGYRCSAAVVAPATHCVSFPAAVTLSLDGGADGGPTFGEYTYALFPQDCQNDLDGGGIYQ